MQGVGGGDFAQTTTITCALEMAWQRQRKIVNFLVRFMENKIVTDFGFSVFQAFAFFSTQATCFISKTTFKFNGLH